MTSSNGVLSVPYQTIRPNYWDDGITTHEQLPLVPDDKFSIQFIWVNEENKLVVLYGQKLYDSLDEAVINNNRLPKKIPS